MAAAGTAARAEDASTLFANPAGMTRLAGNQMALGAQVLYGDMEYKLDGQGALGVQYTLNEKTRLNAGVAFDTSMYEDQSQTSFAIPSGATWRLGGGMQYALSPQSDLGAAVQYADAEDNASQSALVSGGYDNPYMIFMSVHYAHWF